VRDLYKYVLAGLISGVGPGAKPGWGTKLCLLVIGLLVISPVSYTGQAKLILEASQSKSFSCTLIFWLCRRYSDNENDNEMMIITLW